MGKNRRAGRKHTVKPKMWIRCVCGQTLGNVDRPRYQNGRPKDPLWMIGGLSYNSTYNSNRGDKYEHDHFGKVHTHTFICKYANDQAPSVMEIPEAIEPDPLDELFAEETLTGLERILLEQRATRTGEPYDDLLQRAIADKAQRIAEDHYKVNPARFTEAGITRRPRDGKRAQRRCGRVHTVRGQRILDHWNSLAGITEGTPHLEAMSREKAAYLAAGKNWVMVLSD